MWNLGGFCRNFNCLKFDENGRPLLPLPEKITLILHRKVLEITAFQLFETAKFRGNSGGTPREIPGDFPAKKGVDFGGVKTRSRKEQLRVFGKLFQSIKRAPRRGQFSGFFENWLKFGPKMSPFLVLLVFSFTSISTVFHKVFHENFEVIFSGKIGQNLVIFAPDPPKF